MQLVVRYGLLLSVIEALPRGSAVGGLLLASTSVHNELMEPTQLARAMLRLCPEAGSQQGAPAGACAPAGARA